ncbi:MAG: type II toxin-antitoxin system RelE/ParE family toxin [Lachnospiraceae bacterium]|nr:type II toxin-antitoxin system RelE/ParE family toxin [Lachnospiraceae bacterium]
MNYSIHITSKAERDLNEALDYIEFNLLNPEAADGLLDNAEEMINALSIAPKKYKTVDDPVLAEWGVRLVIINNYLAFYIINDDTKTIHILRFLYGKRNWISLLRNEAISLD